MTVTDPYEPPQAEALDRSPAQRRLGWRGVVWFMAPLLLVVAIAVAFDTNPQWNGPGLAEFAMALLALTLPAVGVGYASGHFVHRTGWSRYVQLVATAAALWALVSAVWFIAIIQSITGGDAAWGAWMLLVPARISLLTVPVSLVLATTFRWFHRRQ